MRWCVLFVLILFFSSSVSAFSSDLHDTYNPGETMIVSFSGEVKEPIALSSIKLLRGHVQVPVDFDLKRLGERYHLWIIAPENPNNYTLVVDNVVTVEDGVTKTIKYMKNVSVRGNFTDYSVNPGFIFTDEDFTIEVTSYLDIPKIISTNFPYKQDLTLEPGKNIFDFSIERVGGTELIMLGLGKYTVPVYVVKNDTEVGKNEFYNSPLHFEPGTFYERRLYRPEYPKYNAELVNSGDSDIKSITISYNTSFFDVKPKTIKLLKAQERISINVSMKKIPTSSFREVIYAHAINDSGSLIISLDLEQPEIKNATNGNNVTIVNSSSYYCPQLSGVVCAKNSVCSGKNVSSKDGECCLGNCQVIIKEKSNAWIGYLLAGVVILGLALTWLRYRNNSKPHTTLDRAKEHIGWKTP